MRKKKTQAKRPMIDDIDLIRRARAAYYRGGNMAILSSDSGDADVKRHRNKWYVLLGLLGDNPIVYRVRNDGMLKRLKRWPIELEGV
jgi:hypothetical protein